MRLRSVLFKLAYLSNALPKILEAWPAVRERVKEIGRTDPQIAEFVRAVDELKDTMTKRVKNPA